MKSPAHHPTFVYLFLFGLVLAAVNMRSPIVVIGSVAPSLYQAFGVNSSYIGYLGALPMPLFALGALIAPFLERRFGIENMMIGMTILLSLSVLIRPWFDAYFLLAGTFTLSLAIGMLNALTTPFIKKHLPNHIATATGLFSLSMSVLAGLIAWVVVPLTHQHGWQLGLSSWSVFGLLTVLVWVAIKLKTTPTQTKTTHDSPKPTTPKSPFNAWKNPQAWQMAVFLGLQSMLFYSVASFLPSIGISYGMNTADAAKLALIFQIAAPPAIFLLTFLVKKQFKIQAYAVICAILNAVAVAGIMWLPQYIELFCVLMGFGGASIFTLMLMMFSLRTTDFAHARDLSGMAQAVGYSLAFFGPLLLGLLFGRTQSWHEPLLLLFIAMLINIPFGFWAANPSKIDAPTSHDS